MPDEIEPIGSVAPSSDVPTPTAPPLAASPDAPAAPRRDQVTWSDELLDDPSQANGDPYRLYPSAPLPPGGVPLLAPGSATVSVDEFTKRLDAMAGDMASSLFRNGEMADTPENKAEFMRRIANMRLSYGDVAPDELTTPFAEIAQRRRSGQRPAPARITYL